jgi:hypothetical protein
MLEIFFIRIIVPGTFFYLLLHSALIIWRVLQASGRSDLKKKIYSLIGAVDGFGLKDQFYVLVPMVIGAILGAFGLAYNKQIASGKILFGEIFLSAISVGFVIVFFRAPLKKIEKIVPIFFSVLSTVSFLIPLLTQNLEFTLLYPLIGVIGLSFCSMSATILFTLLKRDKVPVNPPGEK